MQFCPRCGTEYESLPQQCSCGNSLQSSPSSSGVFDYVGDSSELGFLYLKLIGFSILTLGIYSFWGRNDIRQYLWRNMRLAGQPFDYHGTGKDLFMGWLRLIAAFAVLYSCAALLYLLGGPGMSPIVALIYLVGLATIAPLAIHGAVRYRWSRTSWQGRRFAYSGSLFELAKIVWLGVILFFVTFSLSLPNFLTNLRGYITRNTSYAGHKFDFNAKASVLIPSYFWTMFLWLPTLTLVRFWFRAKISNHFWNHTQFAGARFICTIEPFNLFMITFTNLLLIICTLGLAYPWTVTRKMRFMTENMQLAELPPIQLVTEVTQHATGFGEALGEAIGTDAGIDMGFGL